MLTAVWPEIHTVPGMANPVPDIPTPKRGQDLNNTGKSVVLYLSPCFSLCCAAKGRASLTFPFVDLPI